MDPRIARVRNRQIASRFHDAIKDAPELHRNMVLAYMTAEEVRRLCVFLNIGDRKQKAKNVRALHEYYHTYYSSPSTVPVPSRLEDVTSLHWEAVKSAAKNMGQEDLLEEADDASGAVQLLWEAYAELYGEEDAEQIVLDEIRGAVMRLDRMAPSAA